LLFHNKRRPTPATQGFFHFEVLGFPS